MSQNQTFKKILAVVTAIVVVIAISLCSAVLIHEWRGSNVPASATIENGLSAYEIAVESGIFALVAYLGFLFTLIKNAVRFILKSADTNAVIFVATALISICAVSIHGFVDTVFFRPQIQFLFWTMVAVARVIVVDRNFIKLI